MTAWTTRTTQRRTVPHLLVFEPDSRGHPLGWLELLLTHLRDSGDTLTISLVVAPSIADCLARWRNEDLPFDLHLIALDQREIRLCRHRSAVVSSIGRWRTMRRYLRITGADHGHFLGFDLLSLPLAFGLGFGGRSVSGILFRPSIHYPRVGSTGFVLRDRIRDLRKDLLYRRMFRNRSVRTILTLDPHFPEFASNRYPMGIKVRPVPDPDCSTGQIGTGHTAIADEIPRDRIALLLFGALDRRKGVLTLLEAVRRLDPSIASRLALVLAGDIDDATAREMATLTHRIAEDRPEVWIKIEDRRLDQGEIAALLRRSALVLLPYQRFVGSSGVLLWAAAAGKPVLAPDYGLLGRLVREHRLGLTTDTMDANRIAEALATAVRRSPESLFDPAMTRRFSEAHAPAIFARTVLGQVAIGAPVTGG